MNSLEKINKIMNYHRIKEVTGEIETQAEMKIIMYVCWLNWEIRNYKRYKMNNERRFILKSLEDLADFLYLKYMKLNDLCLK